ncbi:MAG: FecR domain-containing protein [Deltaproteobacteria bacterium]|nr:FecR domain-containing protein [Deltaproteobacteria bacterium]
MSDLQEFRQLVRQVAEEPVPDVNWDRVEKSLFDKLDREPIRLPVRRAPAWRPLVGVAAVAAGLAAAASFAITHHPSSDRSLSQADHHAVAPQHADRVASGTLEAASLSQGDRVIASAGSLTIQHPGHAAWTLSDSSRAVVEQLGSVVVIDLESGSVRVEVVPQPVTETFVVRVGETAVSVHGTVFTVERRADRALVQVERGSVAVGPRSKRGQGTGWLMVAPSGASFTLDGARASTFLPYEPSSLPAIAVAAATDVSHPLQPSGPSAAGDPPRVAVVVPTAPAPKGVPQVPAVATQQPAEPVEAPPPTELPDTLTEALAQATLDSIRAQVVDCHRRLRPVAESEGLKLTVQSSLNMTIAPDGHMTMGRFDPPLVAEVQACANAVVLSAAFPKAKNPSTLRLALRF